MATQVSTSENTLTLELVAEEAATEYDIDGNKVGVVTAGVNTGYTITPATSVPAASTYVNESAYAQKVQPSLDKKIICYDTETSGTDPWDYQLYGCSFWDLSKPISSMVSIFGWDEREVTQQIADYLNTEKPYALVQYNNGFDERALLSRFMLYQIKVPGWNQIQQIDVMEILKKGTTQSIVSSQSVGTEEQWLTFFFGETKPFTIAECFEAVRNHDLSRLRIRNRTCVESEGSIYLLFRSVTDEEELTGVETKPTAVNVEEAAAAGQCIVQCQTCGAVNDVACNSKNNTCWRCLGSIPDPTEANRIKEVVRQYDFTKVGITEKTTTTKTS